MVTFKLIGEKNLDYNQIRNTLLKNLSSFGIESEVEVNELMKKLLSSFKYDVIRKYDVLNFEHIPSKVSSKFLDEDRELIKDFELIESVIKEYFSTKTLEDRYKTAIFRLQNNLKPFKRIKNKKKLEELGLDTYRLYNGIYQFKLTKKIDIILGEKLNSIDSSAEFKVGKYRKSFLQDRKYDFQALFKFIFEVDINIDDIIEKLRSRRGEWVKIGHSGLNLRLGDDSKVLSIKHLDNQLLSQLYKDFKEKIEKQRIRGGKIEFLN
jgi:hypothetical protein